MKREALAQKIIVLGIDGFEPRLAKKFMDQGKMPALKAFCAKGSAREDLMLLGSMPTVTPPLWTTLATGANPCTHGITCFFGQHPEHLDEVVYNLDSRRSQAEPLWNVFAEEAHKRTLVWHWPGSSWPPTSESANLHVVDGVQPANISLGNANADAIKFLYASEKTKELKYIPNKVEVAAGTGCVIEDVDELLESKPEKDAISKDCVYNGVESDGKGFKNILLSEQDAEVNILAEIVADTILSPITDAAGWSKPVPAKAKEFFIYVSSGAERRPGLILQDEAGVYSSVELYKSKKADTPYVVLHGEEIAYDVLEEVRNKKGEKVTCTRNYKVTALAKDGSSLSMLINMAMDIGADQYWHPQSLYQEVIRENGYVPVPFRINGVNEHLVRTALIPSWEHYTQWQADALVNFIQNDRYDVIFSHLHNVDSMGHQFWHYAKHQEAWNNNEETYQEFIQEVYAQTDRYIERFLPYLDKWTMIITSDHGLIVSENHGVMLGEMNGVNVPVMRDLGFTYVKQDANGKDLREIDWARTKAVAVRGDHIYINLKGRDEFGIVEPEDKHALEEEIISALYNYRDPKTGKRVVSIALRNKDALLLGMGGPQCGDIIYFRTESFNIIHADSLSTHYGYADTSVSPIFLAAGPGIKENFTTDRIIKQIDVAPTIAVLGGVRMPRQCEGAPVYQILTEEF